MSDQVKPGYATSEFWLTIGAVAVSVAAAYFGWDASKTEEVSKAVTGLVTGAVAVAGAVAVIWRYVTSRENLKGTHLMSQGLQRPAPSQEQEQDDGPSGYFGFKQIQEGQRDGAEDYDEDEE